MVIWFVHELYYRILQYHYVSPSGWLAAGFVHAPPPGDGWLRHSKPVRNASPAAQRWLGSSLLSSPNSLSAVCYRSGSVTAGQLALPIPQATTKPQTPITAPVWNVSNHPLLSTHA